LRIQYPGAIYHLTSRGDHQERVFDEDQDRERFLATLEECCQKTLWQVHAYCLMSNHFHLVAETPSPNLVEGMKWFLGVYTQRFNLRHKVFGHLFSGRYKALIVDGSGTGYLKTVCDYVHFNPVRAGLLRPGDPLEAYHWSSYPLYVSDSAPRPAWLRVDRLLGEWGLRWDQPGVGRQFALLMEARRESEQQQQFKPVQRGWCVGSKPFRGEMLRYIEEHRGKWHYGAELWESAQAKAEQVIAETLRGEGIGEEELSRWRKGHPFKLRLALRLRTQTTVSVEWIARRLHMGTRGHLAHLLNQHEQASLQDPGLTQPKLNQK
jgi:REP element-mobilizing transposase RayT